MKYLVWSKQYLAVLRSLKKAEQWRNAGNFFFAACHEYNARLLFREPLLIRENALEWVESAKTAPLSEIKAEAIANLLFCRYGLSNYIKLNKKHKRNG
jgi:hypothetical protein